MFTPYLLSSTEMCRAARMYRAVGVCRAASFTSVLHAKCKLYLFIFIFYKGWYRYPIGGVFLSNYLVYVHCKCKMCAGWREWSEWDIDMNAECMYVYIHWSLVITCLELVQRRVTRHALCSSASPSALRRTAEETETSLSIVPPLTRRQDNDIQHHAWTLYATASTRTTSRPPRVVMHASHPRLPTEGRQEASGQPRPAQPLRHPGCAGLERLTRRNCLLV